MSVHVTLHIDFEQEPSGEWVSRFVYDDSEGAHEEGISQASFPTREALAEAVDKWLWGRIRAMPGKTVVEWTREQ